MIPGVLRLLCSLIYVHNLKLYSLLLNTDDRIKKHLMIEVKLTCPKCKGKIQLELPEKQYEGKQKVTCPGCKDKFTVLVEKINKDEASVQSTAHHSVKGLHEAMGPSIEWEKRKKVLRVDGSLLIKPRYTWRARIAALLLLIVFVLGLVTGIFTSIYGFTITNPDTFFYRDVSNVSGSVIDQDGIPLSGVLLTLLEKTETTTTNSNGIYLFQNISVGTYTLRADMPGHIPIQKKVTVSSGNPNIFDFVLQIGNSSAPQEIDDRTPVSPKADESMIFSAIPIFAASLAALLGSYLTYTRQRFYASVICALIGIMSIGFILGAILCIVSLFIIVSSKKGFAN